MKIQPKYWKVKLPMHPPGEVLDNSTISEYAACPRKGFYRYGLRRGFVGTNYSLQFGSAYHKYREVIERLIRENGELTDEIHIEAFKTAAKDFKNPPLGHKDDFLDTARLAQCCTVAYERIKRERETGSIEVVRAEDSFDLELPFWHCYSCLWTFLEPVTKAAHGETEPRCPKCGSVKIVHLRHGGRIDQHIKDNGRNVLAVRDFKTTKYKPYNYKEKFDPNNQFFGYTWASEELSGRNFDGAIIETLYNTKTIAASISQHHVSYSEGQIEAWAASMMIERQMLAIMWSRVEELGYLAFPMRTNECGSWGGCPFRECCRSGSAHEIESWLENHTIESTWDFTDPEGEASQV